MNESTKELSAIGASFAANCQPCLAFHVDKARNLGIRDDEIDEAIAVGRMIQKGAMSEMNKFVENLIVGSDNKPSVCCGSVVNNCSR